MNNMSSETTKPVTNRETSLIGKRVSYYEVKEQIGKGGMAVVYKARDKSLDRYVALKVLSPYLSQDVEFEKRFVREARGVAKLDHPNIVQVYTAGKFDNVLFIAMQYIDGKTLDQLIREKGKFTVNEALDIMLQVSDALEVAHNAGLIHRDIKPTNIMIDNNGRVKVMDFGLSRSVTIDKSLTQTGMYLGTPEYSSPEQCETYNLDNRTDIYSLGVVLYEMLSGRVPHTAETPLSLFRKIVDEKPLPVRELNPSIPSDVAVIVEKMLAKNRDERYSSAKELRLDIQSVLAKREPNKNKPSVFYKTLKVASIVLVILVAIAIFSNIGKKDRSPAGNITKDKDVNSQFLIPAPKEKVKLAILDFKNNGKKEWDWLEDGIPTLLTSALADYKFLGVPSHEEIADKFADINNVNEKIRNNISASIGADAYVWGDIYNVGDDMRINMYLFNGNGSIGLLAYQEDCSDEEIDDIVDKFSRNIIQRLASEPVKLLSGNLDDMKKKYKVEKNNESPNLAPKDEKQFGKPLVDRIKTRYMIRKLIDSLQLDSRARRKVLDELRQKSSAGDEKGLEEMLKRLKGVRDKIKR